MARPFLREPRRSYAVKEIWNKVNRLVGMVVIEVPHHVVGRAFEHIVEVGYHLFAASHEFNHAVGIVRNEPSLLQRVALNTAIPLLQPAFLGPRLPRTVSLTRTEPAFVGVENVAVGLRCGVCLGCLIRLAEHLSHASETPVGVSIFESVGQTLASGSVTKSAVAELFCG